MGWWLGSRWVSCFTQSSVTTGLDGATSTSLEGRPTSSSITATTVSVEADALHARLDELQERLAVAEERELELGLRFDPVEYAFGLGCDSGLRSWGQMLLDSYFVGPVWFYFLGVENLLGSSDIRQSGGGRFGDVGGSVLRT